MTPPRGRRRRATSQEQFAASLEIIECEECGTEFNLGGQSYYAPLCPDCNREAADNTDHSGSCTHHGA